MTAKDVTRSAGIALFSVLSLPFFLLTLLLGENTLLGALAFVVLGGAVGYLAPLTATFWIGSIAVVALAYFVAGSRDYKFGIYYRRSAVCTIVLLLALGAGWYLSHNGLHLSLEPRF